MLATPNATAGVLVVRKVTKTAESYTPEGVAKGLAGIGEGLREMAQVVREAMDERDAELRLALGVDEGAIRIAEDVSAVRLPLDGPFPKYTLTYLLRADDGVHVIDPGVDREANLERFLAGLSTILRGR